MLTFVARTAALVVACSIAAQEDPPAKQFAKTREELERTAIAQLRSDDLAIAAWGAYTVAEFRLNGCTAEVRKRLARLAGRTGTEGAERRAAIAMLDALIETDIVVAAEELVPFVELHEPAVVLMTRDPEANRASLLRAFGPPGTWIDGKRRACGNLLARLRDPDFVTLLLRGPWQRHVLVLDPGAPRDLDGLGFSASIGRCHIPTPPGFPPLVRHTFDTDAIPGATLVAPGPMPVFLSRSWLPKHGNFCDSSRGYADVRTARADWFERMLGAEQRATIRAIDEPDGIEWKDRAAVDEYARNAARDAETAWRALVQACVDAKLLTVDATKEPAPVIEVEFVDNRTDTTVRLPPNSSETGK